MLRIKYATRELILLMFFMWLRCLLWSIKPTPIDDLCPLWNNWFLDFGMNWFSFILLISLLLIISHVIWFSWYRISCIRSVSLLQYIETVTNISWYSSLQQIAIQISFLQKPFKLYERDIVARSFAFCSSFVYIRDFNWWKSVFYLMHGEQIIWQPSN